MHCMPHGQVGGLLSGALLGRWDSKGFKDWTRGLILLLKVGCRYNNNNTKFFGYEDYEATPSPHVCKLHTCIVYFIHVHLYADMIWVKIMAPNLSTLKTFGIAKVCQTLVLRPKSKTTA